MRYIFRMLAMKLIMENPSAYGFNLTADQLYQPIEYKVVEVNTPVDDWAAWAKKQGIDYLTLRRGYAQKHFRTKAERHIKSTYQSAIPFHARARKSKSTIRRGWWQTDTGLHALLTDLPYL